MPDEAFSLDGFLAKLKAGVYDDDIAVVQKIIDERKDVLKEGIRKQVKAIFGDDAEIVESRQLGKSDPKEKRNPFLTSNSTVEDAPAPDALADSKMDAKERQMSEEDGPIVGKGGAMIGPYGPKDFGN